MTTEIFTVDAFSNAAFKGNPAGVCTGFRNEIHSDELDALFQKIAMELNLSDTAFITRTENQNSPNNYFLQWFTPKNEVQLCGHATLAVAYIIFENIIKDPTIDEIIFQTKFSGQLKAKKLKGTNLIELDFPAGQPEPIELDKNVIDELRSTLNISSSIDLISVQLCKKTKYLLLHLSTFDPQIRAEQSLIDVNFPNEIKPFIQGVIITTESDRFHFISRFFSPWFGVLEDPVTGSAHTVLTMYWLSKIKPQPEIFHAHQSSQRGGELWCLFDSDRDRILLRGSAVTVIQGSFRY